MKPKLDEGGQVLESGCDYVESIKGIGFKKAHKLVYECGSDFKQIVKKIRREGKHLMPEHTRRTSKRLF